MLNGLLGNVQASADRIGSLFEHLVYSQIVHSAAAADSDVRVARSAPNTADPRGLARFADYYGKRHQPWVFYLGSQPKVVGTARAVPWHQSFRHHATGTSSAGPGGGATGPTP